MSRPISRGYREWRWFLEDRNSPAVDVNLLFLAFVPILLFDKAKGERQVGIVGKDLEN
jgi:hypothetical protein